MTAANDNALTRSLLKAIVPGSILVMWFVSIIFAFAASGGLFR